MVETKSKKPDSARSVLWVHNFYSVGLNIVMADGGSGRKGKKSVAREKHRLERSIDLSCNKSNSLAMWLLNSI